MRLERYMGRIAAFVVCVAALLVAGCSSTTPTQTDQQNTASQTPAETSYISSVDPSDEFASGIHHAVIEIEGYGTVEVALNANVAPITVSNFCHLAKDGFYNGLTFHRIIKDFMVQGGDPKGDGTGGSDKQILGEFSENGIKNSLPHVRGTISMARSSDPNSASSQFFIVQKDASHLDGSYAAFGTVTKGMEVIDAMCDNAHPQDDNGTIAPADQPRITKIEVID